MKLRWLAIALVLLMGSFDSASADPMQQLIDSLGSEFEALIPPPTSSVGTDYPTRQAALGSYYTARSIGLLYEQNQEMLARQDALLTRYDQIIEQNRQIIAILQAISERIRPPEFSEPPELPAGGYSE
jgi:hypothetical protein